MPKQKTQAMGRNDPYHGCTLKDSGERQTFPTGAVRDTSSGKGRYDLISPIALRYIARVMEEGAKKYSARNWEKGMNLCRFIDSAIRHLEQHLEGNRDEPHMAQAAWNLLSYIHIAVMIERDLLPETFNDLPNYLTKDTRIKPL